MCVRAVTTGFVGAEQMEASLVGAEIVVIPAGVPRKPGMTRYILKTHGRRYMSTYAVGM